MEKAAEYCWIVACKNHWFHHKHNLFSEHKILLGVTDSCTPCPVKEGRFEVRCDECGEAYSYKPADVLRFETEVPEFFEPHPLFG